MELLVTSTLGSGREYFPKASLMKDGETGHYWIIHHSKGLPVEALQPKEHPNGGFIVKPIFPLGFGEWVCEAMESFNEHGGYSNGCGDYVSGFLAGKGFIQFSILEGKQKF